MKLPIFHIKNNFKYKFCPLMFDSSFDSKIFSMLQFESLMKNSSACDSYGLVKSLNSYSCIGEGLNLSVGEVVRIENTKAKVYAQVIELKEDSFVLLPFENLEGVKVHNKIWTDNFSHMINPSESWVGRIIDGMCNPIDGKPLGKGNESYSIYGNTTNPFEKAPVKTRIETGIKALNSFLPVCDGQRIGIFAGSGVGKSSLLGMLTKHNQSSINVIGMIGERGRELKEFIENILGDEGMKKTIIVASTSDQSAVLRRRAAYITMTIAEYFRDKGHSVLCMMDSITRFAMANREIGLSRGEPPTTKGYTPSVFTELPKLLERAGNGITGMFSVLVDGDDHNEPIADAIRGILDGHIILDRKIAERGRFPAIDALKSVSRTFHICMSKEDQMLISRAKDMISTYENMSDVIEMGLYKAGSNKKLDIAIEYYKEIEKFLTQGMDEFVSFDNTLAILKELEETILNKDADRKTEQNKEK